MGRDKDFVVGSVDTTSLKVAGVAFDSSSTLALLSGLTTGTVTASKAVVVDASLDIGDFRTIGFTGTATSISVDAGSQGYAAIYIRDGSLKLHKHTATTDTYCSELKFNYQGTTSQAYGIDCTCEIEPGGGTPASRTAGGMRAVQGVARVAAGFTITGGADYGIYGQFCNLGTINGTSNAAAGYFLIEDGGTYTALTSLSCISLDSHLTKVVTSGDSYFVNINNNAAHVFTSAINVRAGNAITNLLRIETAAGMVSANTVGTATFANWKTIKINIDGTTHYLIAAQAITG